MEVRIKQGEEMIDATIEMVDGVMVVSPKEVKFEPKVGDVIAVYYQDGKWIIAIFENYYKRGFNAHVVLHNDVTIGICCGSVEFGKINRYATEEEKKFLFDKLAEKGLIWDSEKKELIKLKWKPKVEENFYYPFFEGLKAVVRYAFYTSENSIEKDEEIQSGKVFKTEQECQEFCNRLNEAINSVKP